MATVDTTRREGFIGRFNGRHHRAALTAYLVVVLGHWAEHLVQAYQIWVLGLPRPRSRGVLGQWFPWLISSVVRNLVGALAPYRRTPAVQRFCQNAKELIAT